VRGRVRVRGRVSVRVSVRVRVRAASVTFLRMIRSESADSRPPG
jgi:hypothetical protein